MTRIRPDHHRRRRSARHGAGDALQLVGTVPQHSWLFSGTVAENLRLAAPQSGASALLEALVEARAESFVGPSAGRTRGTARSRRRALSGGERQRSALPALSCTTHQSSSSTRRRPRPIRSTSAKFSARSAGWPAQDPSIVIAHRLASIIDADRIVVLDQGRIIERGNHRTLLAKRGRYAHFWALQNPTMPDGDFQQHEAISCGTHLTQPPGCSRPGAGSQVPLKADAASWFRDLFDRIEPGLRGRYRMGLALLAADAGFAALPLLAGAWVIGEIAADTWDSGKAWIAAAIVVTSFLARLVVMPAGFARGFEAGYGAVAGLRLALFAHLRRLGLGTTSRIGAGVYPIS